jgi:cell division protein FtsW
MKKTAKIDRVFLVVIIVLALGGFFIFSSASLGLLAQTNSIFGSVTMTQFVSLVLGLAAFYIISKIPYTFWKKHAFYVLVIAIALNCVLFIHALTLTSGGAGRWINLKFITLQPSEFLKIAFIIYFAAWLAHAKQTVTTFKGGIVPFLVLTGILGGLLLAQSDTFTLAVIVVTGLGMLLASGAKWSHIGLMILVGALVVGAVVLARPYARERIFTYLNPAADPQGAGYQIQQSLIAVGSGGMFGRGYGQSVQKFGYLPEPTGDSIFAVEAEEFGFAGSLCLIGLFLLFAFKSFRIAVRAPDNFARLAVVGIATLVIVESFVNISAMLGVIPLTGKPLLFVSHGGTALIIILAAVGIIANISKHQKK